MLAAQSYYNLFGDYNPYYKWKAHLNILTCQKNMCMILIVNVHKQVLVRYSLLNVVPRFIVNLCTHYNIV